VLRGLAALLVAVGHAFWFPFSVARLQWASEGRTLIDITGGLINPFPLHNFLPSGQYPVACFFILSGFVVENALRSTGPAYFLVGRLFRLFPVLVAATLVAAGAWLWVGRPLPTLEQVVAEAFLLGYPSLVTQAWTLLAEVQFYLAAALLVLVAIPGAFRPWVLIAAYAAVGTTTSFWLALMAIGTLLYRAVNQTAPGTLAAFVAGTLAWLALASLYHGWPEGLKPSEHVAALGTLVVCVLFFTNRHMPKPLMWLGDISYPLYCVHLAIVAVCYYLLVGRVPSPFVQIAPVAISLTVAWVMHRWLEEPAIKLGKQITRRMEAINQASPTPDATPLPR
jgi:peptidoglycan/LPS O-acetylase OafA/YrhL